MHNNSDNICLGNGDDNSLSTVEQIERFYGEIQDHRRREESGTQGRGDGMDLSDIPELLATLMGYQRNAVSWMMRREKQEPVVPGN